jgi:hypothetical protein
MKKIFDEILTVKYITSSLEKSPSSEAASSSAFQEISILSKKQEV